MASSARTTDWRVWLLAAAVVLLFVVDLLLPGLPLLSFLVLPVLVAAAFAGPRVTSGLAALALALALVSEVVGHDPDGPPYWLPLLTIAAAATAAVYLAYRAELGRTRLLDRERRLRLMLENSTDVVFELGNDDAYVWVSPSARTVLGWDTSELVGKTARDLVHPDDLPALIRARTNASGGVAGVRSFRYRQADGSYRRMSGMSREMRDADGTLHGRVVGLRDVQAEHEAAEALVAAQEHYRLLAENASDVVFRTDQDAVLTWVSPSVTQALGWEPDQVLGRAAADFLHPDDLRRVRSASRSVLRGDRGRDEVRIRTCGGTYVWMAVMVRPVPRATGAATAFVGSAHNVETEREAAQVLRFLASHDPLTRLANRPALVTRLSRILSHPPRTGTRLAVLFLDMDGLKHVNDTLGHAVGDQVIVEVAGRIAAQVRTDDLIARFGGDEFIVALPSIHAAEDAEAIAAKIHRAVRAPIHTPSAELSVTLSIGIAVAEPGDDPDEVLKHADLAMYRAKNTGRDRTAVYDPAMDTESQPELSDLDGG